MLGSLEPEAILVGSNTARTGIEMFIERIQTEEAPDMKRPSGGENDTRSYWKKNYDHIASGEEHVDLKKALEICKKRYGFSKIVVDSGNTLCGILLDEGLVDRISRVVSPVIVGKEAVNLFGKTGISGKVLELLETETIDSGHIHSIYAINEK
ncbi:MAG: dihydrofolate reductase family protein [Methanolobus sp.]|nr:dihydrofolate reductase family protein [Methanolobus sp.]